MKEINIDEWTLAVSDDPASDITKGCILERPKVIYNARTKKYVMWFHLEPKNVGYDGAMIGIAQADKVTGPYTYIRCTDWQPLCGACDQWGQSLRNRDCPRCAGTVPVVQRFCNA